MLWDTAGQEKGQIFTTNFYREAEGCILVFDLTDKSSFENIEFWRKEFLDKLQPPEGDEYPFILIGNKSDMENFPFVKEDDIKEYCSSHYDMPYFSCSAQTGDNVEEAFTKMAELAFSRVNEKNINISDKTKFIQISQTNFKEKNKKNPNEKQGEKEKKKNCCCC